MSRPANNHTWVARLMRTYTPGWPGQTPSQVGAVVGLPDCSTLGTWHLCGPVAGDQPMPGVKGRGSFLGLCVRRWLGGCGSTRLPATEPVAR